MKSSTVIDGVSATDGKTIPEKDADGGVHG
jgi:hypothetical protein